MSNIFIHSSSIIIYSEHQILMIRKTLGITRNRSMIFNQKRQEKKVKKVNESFINNNRFSKRSLAHAGGQEIEMTLHPDTIKAALIDDLSTVNTIEAPKPVWLGLFDECQTILRYVEELRREMLVNQNKRLTCIKVSEEKIYEMKIYENAKEATKRIKKCEQLLEAIKKSGEAETHGNARICKNICFKLATDIQQTTKQLRSQQKSFIDQRKQFQATEKASFLEVAADNVLMGGGLQQYDQLIEDEAMLDLQARNEEIKQIVQSIYELSDIYRQLSQMVVLQGSLLDRIDENVELSKQAVDKGHLHLVKAEKSQKKTGRCVCGVITVLLVAISILLIILMTRWFK